ncbi:hypothetical protein EGY31_00475 [Burkholderia multivorans]|uniref:hypothetical protein n=1 Tax=Burkholderia ubonensis TaxID=101571 RepID=UPI000F712C8E|nr:hypothetical protein [Burkholderia ubonensis]AYZ61871.1 hypothetical protein EGY31_00475 [Burkholderia multivorans]VWB56437.1 hypothetical protein BUB20358_02592 [Burkholderia ubonensis]
MKIRKPLIALFAITALSVAGTAYAGPKVTVTFKNQGTDPAVYKIISTNESSTYANAAPKPEKNVLGGSTDTYTVQSLLSTDVNYAAVRYSIGAKECQFYTAYVNTIGSGGVKIPKWSKTATPSGGATCTATITSTNIATHEWAVEFDMK